MAKEKTDKRGIVRKEFLVECWQCGFEEFSDFDCKNVTEFTNYLADSGWGKLEGAGWICESCIRLFQEAEEEEEKGTEEK